MNQSKTYIMIQGWMISELQLKGNELILYATIYGFSQDGISEFYGSLSYIEKMLNISRKTVIKSLKSLIYKGFVTKSNESRYKAVINNSGETTPSGETPPWQWRNSTSASGETPPFASGETPPNNNNTNNTNNNNKYIHKKQKFSALNFLKSKLNANGEILNNELLKEVISTRKKRKAENSERALKYFCEQIIKANIQSHCSFEDIIEFYLGEVTWKAFKCEWYVKVANQYNPVPGQRAQEAEKGLQHLPEIEKQRIIKRIRENK